MNITVNTSSITKALSKLKIKADNARPLLTAISAFHLRQVSTTFTAQGKREEHSAWPSFAPQYTRKTDGVTVPAWGGVPKLYGKGAVKGRKRPSGKRITPSSKILMDTGTLRGSFTRQLLENKKVIYGSVLAYAGQHQYGDPSKNLPAREMLFFTENDVKVCGELTANFVVTGLLKVD